MTTEGSPVVEIQHVHYASDGHISTMESFGPETGSHYASSTGWQADITTGSNPGDDRALSRASAVAAMAHGSIGLCGFCAPACGQRGMAAIDRISVEYQ